MATPRPVAAIFLDQNDQRTEKLAARYQDSTIAAIYTDETNGEEVFTEDEIAKYRKVNAFARKKMLIKQHHLNQLMADGRWQMADGEPQPAT